MYSTSIVSDVLLSGAARVYFLTQQRRSKHIDTGKLDESRAKQRRTQRKHNVGEMLAIYIFKYLSCVLQKLRNRRSACTMSTSLSLQEKEDAMKILSLEFISSEETDSESGSGSEMTQRRKIFMSKPLQWRSPQANNIMQSLDRKIFRRRSERAKEMCRIRRTGVPSSRTSPKDCDPPTWAIVDIDD